MTVVGVISEYNPFHLGHEKQFRLIRERFGADAAIVCLMSGNFVQRGAAAVFDKTVRAAAAVDCGASLVLELPVTCALRSAEGFARGGVEILDALGVVDVLCFGSESGSTDAVMQAARTLLLPEYSELLRQALQTGISYPAARQQALQALGGSGALLGAPNDILAVEYCKALLEIGSRITPAAVLREGGYHDEIPDAHNPSATAVRALLDGESWRSYVPPEAAAHYEAALRYDIDAAERAVLARLRSMSAEQWQQTPFGSEGLWSKVYKAVQREQSVEAVIDASKSRRYPRTRLQRLVLCACLGLTQQDLQRPICYVRALAFDETGQKLLRRIRTEGTLPVINAGQQPEDGAYFELERRCAALYGLYCTSKWETSACLEEKNRVYQKKK